MILKKYLRESKGHKSGAKLNTDYCEYLENNCFYLDVNNSVLQIL